MPVRSASEVLNEVLPKRMQQMRGSLGRFEGATFQITVHGPGGGKWVVSTNPPGVNAGEGPAELEVECAGTALVELSNGVMDVYDFVHEMGKQGYAVRRNGEEVGGPEGVLNAVRLLSLCCLD